MREGKNGQVIGFIDKHAAVFDGAGRQEDEVRKLGGEEVCAERKPIIPPTQRAFEVEPAFLVERRVAHFELPGGEVRPEREQLDLVGRAFGEAELGPHEHAVLQVLVHPGGSAEEIEPGLSGNEVVMRQALCAHAAFNAKAALPFLRLIQEHRGRLRICRRDERFIAFGQQFLVEDLDAEGAFESGKGVIQLAACFITRRLEPRAGHARTFEFDVLVICYGERARNPVQDGPIHIQACPEIIPRLLKVNERQLFFGAGDFFVLMTAGQAVGGFLIADGEPREAFLADPGETRRQRRGFEERVLDLIARFIVRRFTFAGFKRPQAARFHKSGYVIIPEIALRGRQGQDERPLRE